MTRETLGDLSKREMKKIEGFLEVHDLWKLVHPEALENPDKYTGIVLVDTYDPDNGAEFSTMATPRLLDDIEQLPLRIREIQTVEPGEAMELGSYPGALKINLTVPSSHLRIQPKTDLRRGEIHPRIC